ncbi:MAG: bifunctional demethylmenaquinone methyltransferase/2-methoxy-6-polyprenyl-1,4-benzoquinol methylase UbiE [Sandaracinaceae bacterium]
MSPETTTGPTPSSIAESQAPRAGSGEMFDRIARRYDLLNRILSLGIDHGWRRRTARSLDLPTAEPTPVVLDLATGTADLAIAVARAHPGARVRGTDPSRNMLAIGVEKVRARGLSDRVTLALGDAQAIEEADASVDAITIAFGIRNVPDRRRALREMARVVKPGGTVAILELGEPRSGLLGPLARFHIRQIVPRLGALLSGAREYRYLQTSIAAFPEPEEFVSMMGEAGLAAQAHPLTFGVCNLYLGRRAPNA